MEANRQAACFTLGMLLPFDYCIIIFIRFMLVDLTMLELVL